MWKIRGESLGSALLLVRRVEGVQELEERERLSSWQVLSSSNGFDPLESGWSRFLCCWNVRLSALPESEWW